MLYLKLLLEAHKDGAKGILSVCGLELTDRDLNAILDERLDDMGAKLQVLEDHGLILRNATSIQVFKFWADKHDRNSERYKEWRREVFDRDGYVCRECGTKKDLQAHHIKTWMRFPDLRYSTDNGITLCRKCHLKAHGGCWKNG